MFWKVSSEYSRHARSCPQRGARGRRRVVPQVGRPRAVRFERVVAGVRTVVDERAVEVHLPEQVHTEPAAAGERTRQAHARAAGRPATRRGDDTVRRVGTGRRAGGEEQRQGEAIRPRGVVSSSRPSIGIGPDLADARPSLVRLSQPCTTIARRPTAGAAEPGGSLRFRCAHPPANRRTFPVRFTRDSRRTRTVPRSRPPVVRVTRFLALPESYRGSRFRR